MYENEAKRLRWLAFNFPHIDEPKDESDKICNCINLYCTEAADAIEHLVRKVMELEAELVIYDELPLIDQREPLKEPCKRCHGKGYINVAIGVPGEPDSFQCGDCNGTGIAPKEET